MPINPKTGLPVKLIRTTDAATHAGKSHRQIYRYIDSGKLTRYRRGPGQVFVDQNELDALFAITADIQDGDN